MRVISKEALQTLSERYPKGTRVELISTDDPFNQNLTPGCKGTVVAVDPIGTIHMAWDRGSSLGVVYGVNICRKISEKRP